MKHWQFVPNVDERMNNGAPGGAIEQTQSPLKASFAESPMGMVGVMGNTFVNDSRGIAMASEATDV